MFRKVNTDGVKQHLQNDPDRIVKWFEKWQMFSFLEMQMATYRTWELGCKV